MDAAASPLALLKDPTLLKTDGLIDGRWVKGKARFDVIDPATGSKLADVADLGRRKPKPPSPLPTPPGPPGARSPPSSATPS